MGTEIKNPTIHATSSAITPTFGNAGINSTYTAGRAYLTYIEVPETNTYSAVEFINGATIAGNIRVGIYKAATTAPTCAGGDLLVESASTAHAGANSIQKISFTATKLVAGGYYIAVQVSDATATILKISTNNYANGSGLKEYYDVGGGFGAFTNPCPAITDSALTAAHITGVCLKVS